MKTKSGEKRFLGIFKKKTTPAPAAPPPIQETLDTNSNSVSTTIPIEEETTSLADSITTSSIQEEVMPPRKGSVAQTSVIHYSPPGTVRASFPPSATSSVVSGGSDDTVVITRKSNIVLDDEESVVSTPISQYDEYPIAQKTRSKRAAPPPPGPPMNSISFTPPIPTSSSNIQLVSPIPKTEHFRQNSTNSISSPPPPPPPHRKQENEIDYEEMFKKLHNKVEAYHQVRSENGGSIEEERMKAEVLKEHEKLRVLLEQQILSDRPKSMSNLNNNNNIRTNNNNNINAKKQLPLKIPQEKPSSTSSASSTIPVQNGAPISPKTDENRNEIVSKKKVSATIAQNTEAVDRLRREVEEQRQREKEVKQYRNPKTLEVNVKSPEPKRKELVKSPPQSPTKSSSGPRMVEYKPMKSPGLPIDPDDIYEEIDEVAPPIPNTPPPKLSEYRKEQQSSAPRMPSVPSNGYVRLQMNGVSKKPAPVAPGSTPIIAPNILKIAQKPYTGPEFASSPKLLRKTPEPMNSTKIYASVPVKEEKKTYEKPQVHPQMTNGNVQKHQGGMISATSSSSSSHYRKNHSNPPMTRGASIDQNGYSNRIPNGISPQKTVSLDEKKVAPQVSSPVNYRKNQAPSAMTRTTSEDQRDSGYTTRTTINIVTSPNTQRKIPLPSPSKSKISPMTRAMSTDQSTIPPSPVTYRKISAPVTTSSQTTSLLNNVAPSPSTNRRSQPISGILSVTSSKTAVTSVTSPPYPKGSMAPTVISIKSAAANVSKQQKPANTLGEIFDISDVLKGPKLRKIGMPVERSGISLGKVVDTVELSNRPTSTPPPPPPPPPPPQTLIGSSTPQAFVQKNPDLRDSLMSEIREAGRLRAARTAQSA
ncbi:hypothetical protein GCK72_010201 [Caenorhabditis remanei]|uniref:WH2 domain-containing protein n=1 Tax=Caenorhabditis remanei TaxID=31234 RepID=A0A6A5H6E2_CAERE|nr:hypothetical protein GCK72_010201 [Caenorhabditis remanei]KAF1761942.1 hypothetical protein GCK72_010201 [Caenorhabditis remanei]